jgi:adhesin transport system membrane fusion protein
VLFEKNFLGKNIVSRLPGFKKNLDDYQPTLVLWLIFFTVLIAIFWAGFSEIDQVTRAQGQVIASSHTQIVQSNDGGIIEEILVKEGDQVKKDEVLVKLDKTKVEAAFLEIRSKVAALKATQARIKAEMLGGPPKFPKEINDYPQFRDNQLMLLNKRKTAIREEIESLSHMRALANKELVLSSKLLKTGDVSLTDIIKLQRQVADLDAQITNKRNKYTQDLEAEFNKVGEDLASTEQQLTQKQDQLNHIELRAPTNGIVKNVRVTTLGGVIKPGEEVMQIVPIEDNLIIEARIKPSDVAFLKIGLPTNIKIDAYDYTIYGSLNGKLTYISPDTLKEDLKQGEDAYYKIQVQTEGKTFSARPTETLEIQPGMTATVEIKTGRNTVLKYVLKPVIKTMNESLGER